MCVDTALLIVGSSVDNPGGDLFVETVGGCAWTLPYFRKDTFLKFQFAKAFSNGFLALVIDV